MSSRAFSRLRLGAVLAATFFGGVMVASGFNLTPFGYAQQSSGPAGSKTPAQVVQPLADASNAFVSIAEHVTPAVVSISTERGARQVPRARNRGQQPGGVPFDEFFKQFDPQRQEPVEGKGSGFIVSSDGYILTNNHVVADADRVNVTLLDKRVFKAKIIGRDPSTDVALIKIDGTGFPTVTLGDDGNERIGEWVLAIGNPLGLDFTVTAGIISAKGRSGDLKQLYASQYAIVDYIQTDAAINPGNSGGPLVNIRGEVIGINSAIASQTGYYSGYGFAIPITLVKSVMNDLRTNGFVRRAVLGVTITEVTADAAQAAGLKEIRGAQVGGYSDDSPAREAGVEPGDIILAIDGHNVDRVAEVQRIVRDHKPGDVVKLDVERFGTEKSFKVKLAEAPRDEQQVASAERTQEPQDATFDKLGISVTPINPATARQIDISEANRGVMVTDIDPNGPAYHTAAGAPGLIPNRSVIVQVLAPAPRRPVRSEADLNQALAKTKAGDVVTLLVYDAQAKATSVVNLRVGS
jgi:serine protease Do